MPTQPRSPRNSDDYITDNSFGDPYPMMAEDMGITKAIQHQLALDYTRNMAAVYDEVLARGMFSWQVRPFLRPLASLPRFALPPLTPPSRCPPT